MLTTLAPLPNASYSAVGSALARQAVTAYNGATQWNDADNFVGTALDSLVTTPGITADEKALAVMGYNMGVEGGMQYQNSAQARCAAAQAIADEVPGPVAGVMANAVENAYRPANLYTDGDWILDKGLESIHNYAGAGEAAQDLAGLGLNMGIHSGMQYQNSAEARDAVIQMIASNPTAPIPTLLASVTSQAVNGANQWDDADNIAGDGLEAILVNPHSSDVQKALARTVLNQTVGGDGLSWQDSTNARLSTLAQIASSN